jgi:hypothetical protein
VIEEQHSPAGNQREEGNNWQATLRDTPGFRELLGGSVLSGRRGWNGGIVPAAGNPRRLAISRMSDSHVLWPSFNPLR